MNKIEKNVQEYIVRSENVSKNTIGNLRIIRKGRGNLHGIVKRD